MKFFYVIVSGSARTAAMTSSTVTSWNWQNEVSREVDKNDGGGASLWVCYYDNSKVRASIFTKLRL